MDQPSSAESNAITLRIKFKSASLDEFIDRYGVDVSPGGIFIRTKQPVDVGTSLQFDFTLADGSPLLAGLGTVAWVRESDPARANNVPGMGLRFDKLTLESQHTHQMILSEKSRKEGKALSTPYPPTSFVSPAVKTSPSPDVMRTAAEVAAKMEAAGPVNLAVTRPAPAAAAKPSLFAASAPTAAADESSNDTDEFESAGKTEITEKPLDFYLKEAAQEAEAAHINIRNTAEEAVPTALIEDFNTDSSNLPPTKNGPPPAGYDVKDSSPMTTAEDSAPAKPLSGERKSGGRAAFASLLDLGDSNEAVGADASAPSEVLDEISAGAPIEETPSEKTEEVSFSPAALPTSIPAPEPFDLVGAGLGSDRPMSRDNVPSLKPKGPGKLIAGIALLAAAAAFGAVYLAKTKPWQQAVAPESTPVPVATPAPVPAPPPAQAKPAVAEEAVAKKAEEAKPVAAAEKAEPERTAAEKPAEKPVAEKPAPDKVAGEKVAKVETEASTAKVASKAGGKAGGKADKHGDEKAGADEDAVYRLVFRSTPIGAEVHIDGEYFGRTPCDRRILDAKKAYVITFKREGYESHERLLGASDNWVKKGNDRILTVTAILKKSSTPVAGGASAPGSSETKAAKAPEATNPETKSTVAPPEVAKPAPAKPEAPKAEAPKPEVAKPEATKPEPAKPAPAEKPAGFKPVPNFDEPGKAKE
ncbi:MAG TPA: TIGR02266 family protein [Polyangia bacterium]